MSRELCKPVELSAEELARRNEMADKLRIQDLDRGRFHSVRISPKAVLDKLSTEEILDYLRIVRGVTETVMP